MATEGGKAKALQAHVCPSLLKSTPHTMDDKLQVRTHTYVQTGHILCGGRGSSITTLRE